MRFEIYRDGRDEYRWRLRAENGRVVAESGEGYGERRDCEHGLELVGQAAGAPVHDLTGEAPAERRAASGDPALDKAIETAFKQGEG